MNNDLLFCPSLVQEVGECNLKGTKWITCLDQIQAIESIWLNSIILCLHLPFSWFDINTLICLSLWLQEISQGSHISPPASTWSVLFSAAPPHRSSVSCWPDKSISKLFGVLTDNKYSWVIPIGVCGLWPGDYIDRILHLSIIFRWMSMGLYKGDTNWGWYEWRQTTPSILPAIKPLNSSPDHRALRLLI